MPQHVSRFVHAMKPQFPNCVPVLCAELVWEVRPFTLKDAGMERKNYYAYNKTRDAFLSLGISFADRANSSFWRSLSGRELKTNEGIWLASANLRRDSGCAGHCDRIYLDSGLRVVDLEEAVPGVPLSTRSTPFASILLLPVHTIFGSQTQPGDQVLIGTIEDIGAILDGTKSVVDKPLADGRNVDRQTRQAPMKWLSKLFSGRDRRRSKRHFSPPLMAFYWDGGIPIPHPVPDISRTGLFVKTADRWFPRTLLRVTLQKQSEDPEMPDETITVQCRVVRTGDDGVGMAFMLAEEDRESFGLSLGSLATRKQLNRFFEDLVADANGLPVMENPYLPFPELVETGKQFNPDDLTAGQDNADPDGGRENSSL